ncbi:DUF7210 family protein [Aquibium microcysteis]|uniref:DUF7210 family protein n=1 Tax=Aquibium microcysteis TaxID=675281 RepID=UPI00165D1E28|nr:hypothetical protein [Aquibium microcysteis]
MKKAYYALVEGFIEGTYREVGARIDLTEAEAEYLLRAGQIGETRPAEAAKQAKAKVKERAAAAGKDGE